MIQKQQISLQHRGQNGQIQKQKSHQRVRKKKKKSRGYIEFDTVGGKTQRIRKITFSNFDYENPNAIPINSPRAIETIRKYGIQYHEIVKKKLSYFKRMNPDPIYYEEAYQHNERQRRKHWKGLLKLYKDVCENWQENDYLVNTDQGFADLQSLLEKIEKRKMEEFKNKQITEQIVNFIKEKKRKESILQDLEHREQLKKEKDEAHQQRLKEQHKIRAKKGQRAKQSCARSVTEKTRKTNGGISKTPTTTTS
mmetsp:Transcript_4494/g.6600  ORF Transcript_4494/g.6600 Transcript_4494/m.6600 type:complete len:252 (-) Transcript_4494:1009-1764(-)